MNSPSLRCSPCYKHFKVKQQSPIEIKQKMRQDYKDRVLKNRNSLMNRFRAFGVDCNIQNDLTQIYENMFCYHNNNSDEDESDIMNGIINEVKAELIQEEMQWLLEEYEKTQLEDVDWSLMDNNNEVVCPVCKKTNFTYKNSVIGCSFCKISIRTEKTLLEVKDIIENALKTHNENCSNDVQFALLDINEVHVYLICDMCKEMLLVI